MKKSKPFLEIFALALHENYRFPILEVLAFLFTLSTFAFASFEGFRMGAPEKYLAFRTVNSLMGLPLFILVMLLLKNVAYGVGNDLEKGTIQTILAYPLKRRSILTAKLLSAVGIAVLLFLSIQINVLFILAPDMMAVNLTTILLTYLANLSFAFFMASVTLLMTLTLKKGSLALVIGIVLFFLFGVLTNLVSFLSQAIDSPLPIQLYSLITPSFALDNYYTSVQLHAHVFWAPSFSEVLLYIGAGYGVTAFLFFLTYLFFCRRLNI